MHVAHGFREAIGKALGMAGKLSVEYHALSAKIKASSTLVALDRAEVASHRVYNAGCLSAAEFGRLCGMISDRRVAMDPEGTHKHTYAEECGYKVR